MKIGYIIIIVGAILFILPQLLPSFGGHGGYKGKLFDWLVALGTVTIFLGWGVLLISVLEMLIGG